MSAMKVIKDKVDWRVLVAAMGVLGAIQIVAMIYGINGTLRTIIVALIALIAGVVIPTSIIKS